MPIVYDCSNQGRIAGNGTVDLNAAIQYIRVREVSVTIELDLYSAAKQLIELRYPSQWGGAAAVRTESGKILTSVSPDTKNDALSLCIEVGAYLEAHKINEAKSNDLFDPICSGPNQLAEGSAFVPATEKQNYRAFEGAQRPAGRSGVGRLGVVVDPDIVPGTHVLDPVR